MPAQWPARIILAGANLHRRMLGVYFALLGPRLAYGLTSTLARCLYRLLPPVRARSEVQCQAALRARLKPENVARVAEQAFVHRVWNLTDLLLADRLLHPGTYQRFGGQVPEPLRSEMLAAQQRGQAAILVSAYYGPFDLLPVFLGYNGIRAAVVYQPHANAPFDRYRHRVRSRSGCELIPLAQAIQRLPRILEGGGTVAIVADHPAERRGLPLTFLGLPTLVRPTVGLLAWRYRADVVVAGIRRIARRFHFQIDVVDVVKHQQWADRSDPVAYITGRYLAGLERLILADPTQYLWAYARWGEEVVRRLAAQAQPTDALPARGPHDTR